MWEHIKLMAIEYTQLVVRVINGQLILVLEVKYIVLILMVVKCNTIILKVTKCILLIALVAIERITTWVIGLLVAQVIKPFMVEPRSSELHF